MSGVANPSSAPASTVLNIFNAVKLEKLIACINALILTALVDTRNEKHPLSWLCLLYTAGSEFLKPWSHKEH